MPNWLPSWFGKACSNLNEMGGKMQMVHAHMTWHVTHNEVIKWKHFLHYWPFVWGIHQSPVNSPYKGQWCRALVFSLIHAWTNGWVNNGDAGDLRHRDAHYDVTVMIRHLSPWAWVRHVLHQLNKPSLVQSTIFEQMQSDHVTEKKIQLLTNLLYQTD